MEAEKNAAEEAMPLFGELRTEPAPPAEPVVEAPAEPAAAEPVVEEPAAPAEPAEKAAPAPVSAADSGPLPEPTGHFGDYLRLLRQRRRLTLQDLETATHIRAVYLRAMEEENYGELPPAVYVLGYIKNLCRFYRLDEETVCVLTSEIRQRVEYESPSDSSKVIRDFEPSLENPLLLRRVLLAGSGLLLLLALAALLVVWFFVGGRGAAPVMGAAPVDEARLLKLQPAPVLEDTVLPIPERSAR